MANELLINGNFVNGTSSWLIQNAVVAQGFDGNGVHLGTEADFGSARQNLYPNNAESSVGASFNVKLENDTDLLVGIEKPSLSTSGVRVFKATTGDFWVRETDSDVQFYTRELGANWFEVKFKVPSPLPVGTKFVIQGRGLIDNVSCVEIEAPVNLIEIVKSNWMWIVGVCAVGIGGYLAYKYYKNRKKRSEAYTNVVPTV